LRGTLVGSRPFSGAFKKATETENQSKRTKLWKTPYLRGDGEALTQVNRSDSKMAREPERDCARWYAAYTASCREKRVAEHLGIRQIESFLPLYRLPRKWKNGCRAELDLPLFPGYVFIRVASTERVRVLEVPGVLSIVSRGRVPEPLQDEIVEALRATFHLREVEPHPFLAVGERVSICAGPFAGLSGIVLRNNGKLRVVVTLNLIMQSVAVEVNIEDLEPVRISPACFLPTLSGSNH
jgi:transcription antitermination factor NusG